MEDDEFFPTEFNEEEVFEKQIYPMLQTILNICDEYDIPMVVSIQTANDGSSSTLSTSGILPANRTAESLRQALELLMKDTTI
jgi:hypothetical protein